MDSGRGVAGLDSERLERALHAARELAGIPDLVDFPSRTVELLRTLIPCDHAGYNVIDAPSGRAIVIADPPEAVFEGGPEVLARFADQNPLIVRARMGDMQAMRLSDHITRDRFHATDLYQYVYRMVAMEHQLVLQLPPLRSELGRPDEVIGLSLARSASDFSDGDVELLDVLQPIFTGTLQRLHDAAYLRAVAADSDDDGRHLLLVDETGTIVWTTTAAEELLDATVGHPLPAGLRAWLAHAREAADGERAPQAVRIFERLFRARLVGDAYPGLDAVHLSPIRSARDPSGLRALGLTRRQSQVFALALDGCGTSSIATRLRLSPRTVEKHFEDGYARLGVHSRNEAVVVIMKALET